MKDPQNRGEAMPSTASMSPPSKVLTHVDDEGRPSMVDVSQKVVTRRTASARAVVTFPESLAVFSETRSDPRGSKGASVPVEIMSAKGPVFATAIIAGTQAAKATWQIIPFCHALPLEACTFSVTILSPQQAEITCRVASVGRTGVEMEALTGVSAAALTVYDMCKALSHDIRIGPIELVSKTGGKRDVQRNVSQS